MIPVRSFKTIITTSRSSPALQEAVFRGDHGTMRTYLTLSTGSSRPQDLRRSRLGDTPAFPMHSNHFGHTNRATMSTRSGIFANAPVQPPTVIFDLTRRFRADTHAKKLNLGVGAYRDAQLKPVVFSSVRKAEAIIAESNFDKEYLPISGLPELRTESAKLIFGNDSQALKDNRVTTVQSLSGTGALTVAAHAIRRLLPGRNIYCSDPTWENHGKVVHDAGLPELQSYRYYDPKTCGFDCDGMLEDLNAAPEGSIILLHAVAHNPTGVDPSQEEWKKIAKVMKDRQLVPWFDCAYQGFASGDPDEDAWSIRYFVDEGFELLVCQSFAKNFGLYNERVGALHVVAKDSESAHAVHTNLEAIIRPMYSNPPQHGARIVSTILQNPELNAEWRGELANAMSRIKTMRTLLRDALVDKNTPNPNNWEHITKQIGMFSYTGLNKEQCDSMVNKHHIYMLDTGRINVAGLNESSIPIAAEAIHDVVTATPTKA